MMVRGTAALTAKKAYTKVISQIPHPGYGELRDWEGLISGMCRNYAKFTLTQTRTYMSEMMRAQICLIGSRNRNMGGYRDVCRSVHWALRKYVEAFAAGCVVVGDVPGDPRLARLMPLRLTDQPVLELSNSVEVAAYLYAAKKYDSIRDEARATILKHFTYETVIRDYFIPVIAAYKVGSRGFFQATRTSTKPTVRNDECVSTNPSTNKFYIPKETKTFYNATILDIWNNTDALRIM